MLTWDANNEVELNGKKLSQLYDEVMPNDDGQPSEMFQNVLANHSDLYTFLHKLCKCSLFMLHVFGKCWDWLQLSCCYLTYDSAYAMHGMCVTKFANGCRRPH